MKAVKSIIDVLYKRSESDDLAYVFLPDGTSASEIRWTFADTAKNSYAFAGQLSNHGIKAGDRVVLAVNPSLEYIAALYGIMQLGAVPVPCFPPLRPKELSRFHAITVDCSPTAIVIDEMYQEPMSKLQVFLKGSGISPAMVYVKKAVAGPIAPVNLDLRPPNDLALIQYTSGSTGAPKGVCITHDNLLSNCEVLGRSMGENPDRVGVSWLPPYHDMGLMTTIILFLYHGWPAIFMSPLHFIQHPLRWLQAITEYRATTTVGPNFSLDMCVEALDRGGEIGEVDLSTVKELYCGAEPINADSLARFVQRMAPLGFDANALIPCYGLAEATLFVSGKRAGTQYRVDHAPGRSSGEIISCGIVDREHTVRIVDTTALKHVPDGVEGEIWVAGRNVAAGYYKQAALTVEVFQAKVADETGTYLRTGDLGFLRSGELFVTGRIKDLIIVNGRNIYPQDVEANVVRADPRFQIAVAFSVPASNSEQLVVVVEAVYAEMCKDSYFDLIERARSSVVREFGICPHVHVGPKRTVPTTTSGKVRRQEAKHMFLANELPAYEFDPVPAM
ncbi:fatty acyl-AMP ligase [Mycobacterium sp.]|uniref:fatty acyl-AMP ligase n=1 Tax=Mycobacterium sp. TaxID=1785 RepID=UPI003C721B79